MQRLTVLLLLTAIWHVGVAVAGAWAGLDLVPFLVLVAASAAVAVWAQRRFGSPAALETEVWSAFGVTITADRVMSLVIAAVSSMGFYWAVWPRYGWDGYLAAVAISYGVSSALSSGFYEEMKGLLS